MPSERDDKYALLLHFLAALAYRTGKTVEGSGEDFGGFEAGNGVRSPKNLIRHMRSVLGYARTHFIGGSYRAESLPSFSDEIASFHEMLESLGEHLRKGSPMTGTTPEKMLQGPFADAMTHAGQIAMLRRMAADPVPAENFIVADISPDRLGPEQAAPVAPDQNWHPQLSDTGFGPAENEDS